jgi:hypothetical protein
MLACRSGQIVARTATVAYAHASRRLTLLPNPLKRVAMLIGALSLLAVAGPVAAANAIEPATSQITSPAGPTYALNDESEASPPPAFKVEGTTNIGGMVALRCYYGAGTKSYSTLASEVAVSSGAFSAAVEPKSLYKGPCVLRAVPVGNEEAHPPAAPSEEVGDPFKGPHVVGSRFQFFTENGITYDYEFEPYSLSSFLDIESVGDCGLDYSRLYAQDSLLPSDYLFDCNAALYSEDDPSSGPSTRSELQIDGANAYSPTTAQEVERELKTPLPGAPQVAVTKTFDPSTGLVTIDEVDPIVKCAPSTAFPPTSSSCTSFVSTGVQLERKWQTSNANQVAAMTDSWKSTDGAAHSLNALYDQETVNGGKEGGAYRFPSSSSFSPATKGETVATLPGTGTIYYKEDAETPNEGDGEHPQGAIVYDTPPSGAISVYRSTVAKEGYNGFEMPYQATIPAGGSYTLRMAFVQAYKLSEVEALSAEVLAGYPPNAPPALSITSPMSGATVSSPSVTVSGIVTDKRAITSFTVDGKGVTVGSEGKWSTSVTLNKGANTITALATDQAGFSTEKSVSVTYTPTTPPPPAAQASQVGAAKGKNGEVTFKIACRGDAGTSCSIGATLTTVEKVRHGKLVAVSARRHPTNRSEEVTVGTSNLTIPAGQKVTISIQLNSTGKALLSRFGRLPVHLSVIQGFASIVGGEVSPGHHLTVISQNLTVTTHPRPRRHHHHHHHHHG